MRKIIYFLEFADLNETTSVLKKAIANVTIWREQGEDAELVIYTNVAHGRYREIIAPYSQYIKVFCPTYGDKINKLLRKIGNLLPLGFASQKKCFEYIHQQNPKVVYHRSGNGNWLKRKVVKNLPTVWELNSILEYELRNRKPLIRFIVKRSTTAFYELCATASLGLVSVTQEIADFYAARYPQLTADKILISPNSIQLSDRQERQTSMDKKQSNDIFKIAFIGSPNQFWHGLDIIEKFAEETDKFEFHLIGFSEEVKTVNNRTYYPYLTKQQYEKILSQCDIGLGTCGLFRKKMKEACPLKVREYLRLGLPVILPYFDTGLSGKGLPFVLEIESLSENVELIEAFCKKWRGQKLDMQDVEEYISMETFEKRKLSFINSLC